MPVMAVVLQDVCGGKEPTMMFRVFSWNEAVD